MADARSPFASDGLDGATTLSPGAWRNHASGFCEWNGPPEKPPPDGSRTVIGTATPWRKCIFAATFTSWSKPHEMKSANCISQTGRMPSIAAPTAVPTIACSASGASHTRPGPNSSMNPSVTLNAPPNAPMSSPRQKTDSSARISSRSPSEMACRYVISAIAPPRPRRLPIAERRELVREDAVAGRLRVGHRLRQRPFGLSLQLLLHGSADRLHVILGQLPLVRLDRVALRPG